MFLFLKGFPTKLKEFFQIGRLVFTGKAVMADMTKVASLLEINLELRDNFKYIESDELFDFTFALLKGYDSARRFLRVDRGCSDEKQEFRTCINEVSLKTICALAWPDHRLLKSAEHRNQFNNFDEWKGNMGSDLEDYGVLDANVSLGSCIAITEYRLGLSPFFFLR